MKHTPHHTQKQNIAEAAKAPGQACALAGQCRWFSENGTDALLVCPRLRRDEISNLVTELVEAAR
jgi:hypothetical protein